MTERICCEKKLDLVTVFDNPDTGIAYNLYQCSLCGSLYRASVWKDEGWYTLLDFTPSPKEEFKCPVCADPDFNCHHDEE